MFTAADYGLDVVEVWPENWDAWLLFARMQTQWAVGFSGRTGLRYEALYPLLDRLRLHQDEWEDLFDDVRHMEVAALTQMSKNSSET
jgi:hypothetical protein